MIKLEKNNYTLSRLAKKSVKFDNDYRKGTVTVSRLDNIRELMTLIKGLFDLSNKAKAEMDDISFDCLCVSDMFNPEMDDIAVGKKIHNICISLIGTLRTENIDIF